MKKFLFKNFIFLIILFSLFFCACEKEEEEIIKKEPNSPITNTIKLTDDNVILETDSYTYDGNPKTPKITILKDNEIYCELTESNDEFDVIYEKNIEIGLAVVRIMAKDGNKYFNGLLIKSFKIKEISILATTIEELQSALSTSGARIEVKEITQIEKDINLTINESVTVIFETNALIKNYANIINNGVLIFSGQDTKFDNLGTISNYGKLKVENSAKLFNLSTIENKGTVQLINGGNLISNTYLEKMVGVLSGYYVRSDLKNQNFSTPKTRYEYTSYEIKPAVISDVSKDDYSIRYENNINVSKEAKIYITAKEDSYRYYGSNEITFTIYSVDITIKATDSTPYLMLYLNNPNYKKITIYGTRNFEGVTIHEGVVVNIYATIYVVDTNPDDNKNGLTNYGTINNSKYIIVDTGELDNQGVINNNGDVHIEENTLLKGNNISNGTYGKIYAKSNENINQDVIIKEQLTIDCLNINFARQDGFSTEGGDEDWKFAYNGDDQCPEISFKESTVSSSTYTNKRYKKENDREIQINTSSEIGNYNIKITCEKFNKYYYGEVSQDYFILPTVVSFVPDVIQKPINNTLTNLLNDPGYKKFIIGYDLYTENESINAEIVVTNSGVLKINKNCIINSTIENNGKIIQGYNVTNDNNIQSYTINLSQEAQITNNGEIYANKNFDSWAANIQNVYIRKNIVDITCQMLNENNENISTTTIYYGDGNNTPDVNISIEGEPVDKTANYSLTYPSKCQYGANVITVYANQDSKLIYGKKQVTYYIKQGVISVSSYAEFAYAINDLNRDEKCNYGRIKIAKSQTSYPVYSFYLENNITVPEEVVLDMSEAVIQGNHPKKIINKGTIIINKEIGVGDTLLSSSSTGRTVALVYNLDELNRIFTFELNNSHVILMNNITVSTTINSTRSEDIVIYLNDHTLDGNGINPKENYEIRIIEQLPTLLADNRYYWN